ncbi:MAG: caspase family protein [Nitrospira sp.]|nr:caspase family protein [Nitrospira sp.]
MKARSRSSVLLTALLLILAGALHDQAAGQTTGGTDVGTKRALLIGINKYRAVPKLQGSLNDIETMRQILITRWGFSEQHIRLLTDEQATRAGILAALNQFVGETVAQDMVYIHYSGHGSQVADLNGDEPEDHLDETLVPQDGRSGTIPDITDDELEAIFKRLPTSRAFIVLDSCHSGTATRSLDIRTRSIPQDTRLDLYRPTPGSEVRTRGGVQTLPARYVLMTGAASHQEALDGPVEGRYHGFFSYALSRSLRSSPSTASPREVFRGVETELKRIQLHFGRASMPEPQLEAPPDLLETPLLGSSGAPGTSTAGGSNPRLAWIEVKSGEAGSMTLVNGLLLGAVPGSTWAVYPPGDTAFVPGHAVAIATVTQLAGQDAKAKYQPADKKIPDHARAVAFLPAPTGDKIPIHILEVADGKRRHIEDVLVRYIPHVAIVGPDQSPRYLVQAQDNEMKLFAADGLQLVGSFAGDADNWGAGVAMVVSRSATASELLTLDNPSSQLRIDVRVANAPPPAKPSVGTRGIAVVAANTQPAKYRIRKSGKPRTSENSLQLEIKVSADSYLTVVDVDAEGGVNLLFPNDYSKSGFYPEGRVRAGEMIMIPDSLQNGNKAGFYWDYVPPKGTDTVRVFSSTDLDTAQLLRQRIRNIQAGAAVKGAPTVGTRAVSAEIGGIRDSLTTRAARGIIPVFDPTPHVPGQAAGEPQPEPVPTVPAVAHPELPASADAAVMSDPEPAAPAGPPPDWAATSITIKVEG